MRVSRDENRCVVVNAVSGERCLRPRAVYGDGEMCGLHWHHKKRKDEGLKHPRWKGPIKDPPSGGPSK